MNILNESMSQCRPSVNQNTRKEKVSMNYLCHLCSWGFLFKTENYLPAYYGPCLFDMEAILPQHACPFVFTLSPPKAIFPSTVWALRSLLRLCIFVSCSIKSACFSSRFYPRGFCLSLLLCTYSRTFWPVLNEHRIYVWQIFQPLPKTRDFSVLVQKQYFLVVIWHSVTSSWLWRQFPCH